MYRRLAALFDLPEVQNYLLNQRIKWRYNLPKVSWWGGLFERLVGMPKRCLKKIIGKTRLPYDELLTAVTEVEGILNSRPLTYIQSDDIKEVLTVSHLLTERKLATLPEISELKIYDDDEYYEQLDTREHFTKRASYLSRILKNFWKKWRKDYLVDLCEHHRNKVERSRKTKMSVGDIVTVHEQGLKKGFWKIRRIESLIKGQDDIVVRGAELRISSRRKKPLVIKRPSQNLFPLEVNATEALKHKELKMEAKNENELIRRSVPK